MHYKNLYSFGSIPFFMLLEYVFKIRCFTIVISSVIFISSFQRRRIIDVYLDEATLSFIQTVNLNFFRISEKNGIDDELPEAHSTPSRPLAPLRNITTRLLDQ